jgi:seryl-tRNA synthetase
MCCIVENY